MTVYLALLLAGTLLGLLFTPLVTSASTALGLVDAPGGRKVHSTAVPRVGGLVEDLVQAHLRETLGVELDLRTFLELPTVEAICRRIEAAQTDGGARLQSGEREEIEL